MLKTRKYTIGWSLAEARFLLLLVMMAVVPVVAQGQVYYTITNGHVWNMDGNQDDNDLARRYALAIDAGNDSAEVHPYGAHRVTQITEQGTVYFALDITTDPDHPAIVARPVSSGFTPYCAWYRTGRTGYYYQEWGDYRYYIVGTEGSNDTPGVQVTKVRKGDPLGSSSTWYDWDFGLAVQEGYTANGKQKYRYYWLMYDETNDYELTGEGSAETPRWRMSASCYERPETEIYTHYPLGSGDYKYYFDAVKDLFHDNTYAPAGQGALFLPVNITSYDISIASIEEGYGLTGFQSVPGNVDVNFNTLELKYDDGTDPSVTSEITVVPVVAIDNAHDGVPMMVRPAYTEYDEERYRRGIHLKYWERTADEFGSAGEVPATAATGVEGHTKHYFDAEGTLLPGAPEAALAYATVSSVSYSLDNHSRRYLSITQTEGSQSATIAVVRPPSAPFTATLTVVVTYDNGATQEVERQFRVSYEKARVEKTPVGGPVVHGSLFGGGRMARVAGNTNVNIHNADTIYAVYGGNDIAGWVQGQANLQIGSEYTSEDHPVHIGWVYGGGCGYYTYQGINDGYDEETGEAVNPYFARQSTALMYQAYYFNGKVYPWNVLPDRDTYLGSEADADRINHDPSSWPTVGENRPVTDHEFTYVPYYLGRPDLVDQAEEGEDGDGTIPYVKTAHITVGVPEVKLLEDACATPHEPHVHNDHIVIDSLFGGAENAFIGVTANSGEDYVNGVTIDVNGGTIYALFGGNNIGGSVANTSTVLVNVHDTKLTNSNEYIENTFYSGYGRDFGICSLYGGGNMVKGTHAQVSILGGMIDSVFCGGNNATVDNAVGIINCRRSNPLGTGSDTLDYLYHNGHFIYTNFSDPNDTMAANIATLAENYEPDLGRYNVRSFFGGNNRAPMSSMAIVALRSGGIGSVFGGGNAGDMNGEATTIEMADNKYYSGLDNFAAMFDAAFVGARFNKPAKVSSVVASTAASKAIVDYIYGGCRKANVKNSCGVFMAGGTVGYVFGGNDLSGDIGTETGGASYAIVTGTANVLVDVFAGSDGFYHCEKIVDGKRTGRYNGERLIDITDPEIDYDPYNEAEGELIPTQNFSNLYISGGTVHRNVYGGGLLASVGFADNFVPRYSINHSDTSTRKLTVPTSFNHGAVHSTIGNTAHIKGNVYGGGYQGSIYGQAYLRVEGAARIDGSYFAGNDLSGSVQAFGGYYDEVALATAYASCANASDSATALDNAYSAFEASDGRQMNVKDDGGTWNSPYSSYLRIEDTPHIGSVYGSGNGAYNYTGDRPEYGAQVVLCANPSRVDDRPLQKSAFIDIHTNGTHADDLAASRQTSIDSVFGGGNGVGVESAVTVLLNCTENTVHTVHTIFGGNNRDDMAIVPDIDLKKGVVNTVFGGSNNGKMTALLAFDDICGHEVTDVSTHVVVNNADVTIEDTLFGGNRMSDIVGSTFVEIKNSHTDGINTVFGGNDVSGSIGGMARVDVSGGTVHHLYGGSNGRYDFVEVGLGEYNVYPFRSEHSAANLITVAARPDVDSTSVNIWGGTIVNDVYGGGSMTECRTTHVELNDLVACGSGNATVQGTVYGGGSGDWQDLNALDIDGFRYGNVTEATHVDLRHITTLASAKVYGGGRGGDVLNTYVTAYPTWNTTLQQLFGGCWGADVFGTTHVELSPTDNGSYNVVELFGGNDFSGDVYHTDLVVNSGKYSNIYGGSNGDYAASVYNTGRYADTTIDAVTVDRHISKPNSESIDITFNNGTVDSNLYGGGKLGTAFRYQREAGGELVRDANGRIIPDTTLAYSAAHSNPLDYSYIIVNIHDGQFHQNIFGGARGKETDRTIMAYGLKEVNMDGGHVHRSLYGGSQNVNDGYYHEAVERVGATVSATNSTLRPANIINITGGTVDHNVYGGGLNGTIYGSTYINIGTDAIDSCVAFSATVAGNDSAYWQFKPGVSDGLAPALAENDLLLNHSVYSGSDWGEGTTGSASFTANGYYGGESMVYVDGKGYNTANDPLSSLPQMNIAKSLFGSGTSVKGGDKRSNIDLRNYGVMDENSCMPTRTLESVQRADDFFSHNTAVRYTGATDATSAYHSEPYAINNISNVMSFRGFNVAEYEAKVDNVWQLKFYEEALDASGNLVLVPVQTLREHNGGENACSDNSSYLCANASVVNATTTGLQHTLLILDNGIDFKLYDENTGAYGSVYGFGFVMTPWGYTSSILGYPTAIYYDGQYYSYTAWDDGVYDGFSGFVSPCESTNKYAADRSLLSGDWVASTSADAELPYTNYLNPSVGYLNYREWKVGTGERLRETTILAHSNPTRLPEKDANTILGVSPRNLDLAVATASIELPPTSTGHYYTLDASQGIILTGENSAMTLIDSAWHTSTSLASLATAYQSHTNVNSQGTWYESSLGVGGTPLGVEEIVNSPTNTFGLVMVPGANFTSTMPADVPTGEGENTFNPTLDNSKMVLSGNDHVNTLGTYASPTVVEGDRIMPVMNFMLTYDPSFTSTFLGTVDFTLNEYDASGELVGPVTVKVYISTIVSDFRDIEETVLAMYNGGTSNTFKRKIYLPMTLDENRDIFIQSVRWVPTTGGGTDNMSSDLFKMVDAEEHVLDEETENHSHFVLTFQPTDESGEVSDAVGWADKVEEPINIYNLAHTYATDGALKAAAVTDGASTAVDLRNEGNGNKGVFVGTHDARGTQTIDINLGFDGTRVYDKIAQKGYVGKVELQMNAVTQGTTPVSTPFTVTIYVKTREHGDTIYLATANSVSRGGYTVHPYSENTQYQTLHASDPEAAAALVGKSPNMYVQSFQHALSTNVYQEGDVVAIIDEVDINGGHTNIQGRDGSPIQVIRYEGHHHELPGEAGVYRGPMINVSNGGTFFAQHIAFHGSAGAHIKNNPADDVVVPDTNRALAPIFMINGGEVDLRSGTSVRHNWNTYSGSDSKLYGAVSVTNGGVLSMKGDVEFLYNLSTTLSGDPATQPMNGAIYVDGGRVVLPESGSNTGVVVQKNYLVPATTAGEWTSADNWWIPMDIDGDDTPDRWALDETKFASSHKANVFLTRTAATGEDPDLHDAQTDVITITGTLGDNTSIGVRKWFPGLTTRDTIRVAINGTSNPTILRMAAVDNENITSDDGYNVFYNAKVNNNTIYLQRCATFKHQVAGINLPIEGMSIAGKDVLHYGYSPTAACPNGGDSIIYRVQGGFMPYTFTWSGAVSEEHESPYYNSVVQNALDHDDPSYYIASTADTLLLPSIAMAPDETSHTLTLNVLAKDASGVCELTKDIQVTLHKQDLGSHQKWEPVTSPNGWTDTNSAVVEDRKTAVGNRYYEGVVITPMVWADRSAGTIAALVGDERLVYRDLGDGTRHPLEDLRFCSGEVLRLKTEPKAVHPNDGSTFIMWDIDPFYSNPITYVVPPHSDNVIAYYGPNEYWHKQINTEAKAGAAFASAYDYTTRPTVASYDLVSGGTSTEAGFVTNYNGDVHIYNENGLAWFISVINGLNGQQARPMYFNRVFIHMKDNENTPYDMKDYKWFPVGSAQYGFRGRFIGVGATPGDTVHLASGRVAIKNIIVNEPDRQNVGFFGYLDTAKVSGIELQGILARGSQYVGGFAGVSEYTRFDNVAVSTEEEGSSTTSIITTRYASGGIAGKSDHDKISNSESHVKYVGDAVYSGGLTGDNNSDTLMNNVVRNDNRMSGLYVGGLAGRSMGQQQRPNGLRILSRHKGGEPAIIVNNYVRFETNGRSNRVGGLVGYAENTIMENNYVYGQISGSSAEGGVAADLSNDAAASKNYYASGDVKQDVGSLHGNATLTDIASFNGSGNRVTISQPVYGVSNLTRVLNRWVREHNAQGQHYNTWRSDLVDANNGYPVFGEPDLIPVEGTQTFHGCDEVVFNGVTFTSDSSVTVRFIDTVEMVDSTLTAFIVLHHGTLTELSDSASLEEGYEGYGFSVTAAELHLLELSRDSVGHATLVLTDTLSTEYGCDSIVVLTLTLTSDGGVDIGEGSQVNVYPNPTVNIIHVEAKEMSRVEVYDNEGRVLQRRDLDDVDSTVLDLSHLATGIYFVRVHTPNAITIQKVIKQ